jgi:prolyl-tRNA editing enzyme YbaK/EbsC (Cys-tRNA(Pro) deacylase)
MGGKESKPSSAETPSAETPSTSTSPPPAPSTSADPAPPSSRSSPTPDPARLERLVARQTAILASLDRLESRLVADDDANAAPNPARARGRFPLPAGPPESSEEDSDCATARRLNDLIVARGASPSKFVRVPAQYYDEDLPFRAACVGAPSVHHMCKTICMENTRCTRDDCEDPVNSRWYLVLVQYTARLSQQKLEKFLHQRNNEGGRKVGKKAFHMRLAKEEDSERLTGYEHGAVTPFGTAERVPVLVSREMETLAPGGEFWLGGGEVDLKMRVSYDELVSKFDAVAVDCTYDE